MFRRTYSVKINALASLSGNVWAALLNIIAVPFYLHFIGIESYGLVGVFTTLQSFVALLDLGISSTINRELARLSGLPNSTQEMHNVSRTLSIPNWISAFAIATVLSILAPVIAQYWIHPKELSLETVTQALHIIGVNIAIQFSINFYAGGLMGLQKQVLLSVINGICATLRSVGALIVLIFISQTIQAFLLWQTFVIVLQLLLLMSTMGRSLPDGMPGQFKWDIFSKIWRFAAGVSGISVLSLILNQTDKLILSRMVDLEHFGYYMLAVTIASTSIVMFVGPLSHAVYPEFARLISAKNENALTEFYHRSCETVSAIVFPVTAVIVFFSYEILFVWTGNREIATNTFLILTLIALGSGLNASMWPLHFLQLAHGWTSLVFKVGIALVVFVTPAIVFGVYTYGAIGGAAGWAILTAIFIPIMVHMMHRRILRGEKTRWYLKDFFAPLIVAGGVAGTMRLFLPMAETRLEVLIELFAVSTITLVVTVLATTATRNFVEAYWRKARQGRK